jgi:hypothetical protein
VPAYPPPWNEDTPGVAPESSRVISESSETISESSERECFLLYVQEEALRDLLRVVGRAMFDAFLNARLPEWPEGVTVAELRAALADLRHLQGYFAGVGREHEEAPLTEPETVLSQLAARQAVELACIADTLDVALAVAAGKGVS